MMVQIAEKGKHRGRYPSTYPINHCLLSCARVVIYPSNTDCLQFCKNHRTNVDRLRNENLPILCCALPFPNNYSPPKNQTMRELNVRWQIRALIWQAQLFTKSTRNCQVQALHGAILPFEKFRSNSFTM